ncbi:hypothetical protein A4U49_04305 [Acidithiobacillus ferrivorans]|uniref:tyrosine-type recombinase/integrase n=1 Tax=Acidithiobacillus ferrivorans TaxID=160808 RepID=UPI0008936FD9|nr:tyrosine-type recombinase/integrase [Acidithiobacillus ferrivorans]OFA17009.1 hypothetical protein A4U49_04305 [Acidithiobacillus ferrivorans]
MTQLVRRAAGDGVSDLEGLWGWLDVLPVSRATLMRYRCAVKWLAQLRGLDLSQFPTSGGQRIKRKDGPGKRMKSFGARWEPVKKWLMANRGENPFEYQPHPMAVSTALWMEGVSRCGIRPHEWASCVWDDGVLWVASSKMNFSEDGKMLRGNGIKGEDGRWWRALDYRDAADDLKKPVQGMVWLLGEMHRTEISSEDALEDMARWLRRAWDAIHGDARPRITLYTARHQFSADMKKQGIGMRELAAAMGHASIKTASSVYGKARWGRSAVSPGQQVVRVPAVIAEQVRGDVPVIPIRILELMQR